MKSFNKGNKKQVKELTEQIDKSSTIFDTQFKVSFKANVKLKGPSEQLAYKAFRLMLNKMTDKEQLKYIIENQDSYEVNILCGPLVSDL